jgi:hypothetical protein
VLSPGFRNAREDGPFDRVEDDDPRAIARHGANDDATAAIICASLV